MLRQVPVRVSGGAFYIVVLPGDLCVDSVLQTLVSLWQEKDSNT